MKKHLIWILGALLAGVLLFRASDAEAKFVFIYNHPDLEWYTIDTEHFTIYYPRSRTEEGNEHFIDTEVSAGITARVAEEMWPRMCSLYNYFLKEKINIVIVNQNDYLEGFTIPSWDWIVISVNPGSYFYRQRGRMEWISDVLVHEFSHVVSLKQDAPLSEGTFGVLMGGLYDDGIHDVGAGAELFLMDADPHFWVEGTAEGGSDACSYNWWTSARDMNLRMTTLEGRLLDLDDLHGLISPWGWNDWERSYQQGYSINLYLRGRFGTDVYNQFAAKAGERWRGNWLGVVEDVTGIDARTLYEDWKQYVTDHYTAQAEAVIAEGEAVGREILSEKAEWEFATPSEREAWQEKRYLERWDEREGSGTWVMEPRYDAETGIFGINWRGRGMLAEWPIDREVPFTGKYMSNPGLMERASRYSTAIPMEFMHGWDFIPGQKSIVITGNETMFPSLFTDMTNAHFEADGYYWKQLWVVDILEREDKKHGVEFNTWAPKMTLGKFPRYQKDQARPIPNTLRSFDPAVSPDGKRVAFFQYHDGTLNLATINLDGSDKKFLTDFNDGTWMQRVDWSPDGTQLVFSMLHNYQQNMYIINVDGTGLRAITWDGWEEMDTVWSEDGHIYFSADPDGIYNIYAYDTETEDITQITNVVSGAECPLVTPEGNLVYMYYDAFGWKMYGLGKSDFFMKNSNHKFVMQPEPAVVAEDLAFSEDLSSWAEMTNKYRWSHYMTPPHGYLMFRLENDTMTTYGIQGGGVVWWNDYLEMHNLTAYALLGEDSFVYANYANQMWYPNIMVDIMRYQGKSDYGYWIDLDDREETTEDQWTMEGKRTFYQQSVSLMIDYPWNERWYTGVWVNPWEYGFRYTDDEDWTTYMLELESGLDITYTTNPYDYSNPNPRKGRNVEMHLSHGWTDIVFEDYGGVTVDDGELLDAYQYNKAEVRWTEQMNIPTFGIGFLEKAREKSHRIQFDTNLGFVDRNVDLNDEFSAGGKHPYDWGTGSLRPNTLFSGYPAWSIYGETMAIFNLAYRFPIYRHINYRMGPLYIGSTYAQIGGTAGNLWSFRPPDDEELYYRSGWDERIARDPADVYREIPFVDKAYKNGNYLLYDANVELRMTANLFAASWNSFLRLAYGFNEIRGIGDVNGDDIYDTSDNALNDELSNETEAAGLRVYVGIGTGW